MMLSMFIVCAMGSLVGHKIRTVSFSVVFCACIYFNRFAYLSRLVQYLYFCVLLWAPNFIAIHLWTCSVSTVSCLLAPSIPDSDGDDDDDDDDDLVPEDVL